MKTWNLFQIFETGSNHNIWTQVGKGYDDTKNPGRINQIFAFLPMKTTLQLRIVTSEGETLSKDIIDSISDRFNIIGKLKIKDKTVFKRIGYGYKNKDGSINETLLVLPFDNRSILIPETEKEKEERLAKRAEYEKESERIYDDDITPDEIPF